MIPGGTCIIWFPQPPRLTGDSGQPEAGCHSLRREGGTRVIMGGQVTLTDARDPPAVPADHGID
jgi:hypothetical protein